MQRKADKNYQNLSEIENYRKRDCAYNWYKKLFIENKLSAEGNNEKRRYGHDLCNNL